MTTPRVTARKKPFHMRLHNGMAKPCFIYIVSNENNRVIYTGITSHLTYRIGRHKYKQVKGFTDKYNVHKLVY